MLGILSYLDWPLVYLLLGFPGDSDGKESGCSAGDQGLVPGWEDSLEEGMATHSSVQAWRIPMDRGAWGVLQYMGLQTVGHDGATKNT